MEILLQRLREHQEALFGMDRPYGSLAEEGQHTMPLRKYVSVFRIDGAPILPPLMTSEKRRQMQLLKAKAMKIEQHLKERKQRVHDKDSDIVVGIQSETSRSSLTGNISQRSQDYYDAKLKESEESMILLQEIIRRQSGGGEVQASGRNSHTSCSPRIDEDKLKKLQKSETLIYDNSTNEVIKQIQDIEEPNTRFQDKGLQLRELERMANLNYLQPKKPSQLLLAGINDKGGVSIPSICLNPPTPLVGVRKICDALSGCESNDSLSVAEASQQSHYVQDDLSSDESFNSMLTHSDIPPTQGSDRKNGIPRSGKIHDLKAYNSPSNVSAKIQQFEAISSDHSSPTATPNSSPDKTVLGRTKLGLCSTALSRSATSPSIKLSSNSPRPQTSPGGAQNTSDNSLVRSSSFTLEAPSKALIDHMRQQRMSRNSHPNAEVIQTITPLRKISSPSRVHRDTIESKAKRVQKVELKPSRQKIQQKTNHNKFAHAAASRMSSPYPSTFPSHSSTSNLYKKKKSPYDTPNSTRSVGHITKNSSSTPVRKTPISSLSPVPSQKLNKSKSAATVKEPNPAVSPKPLITEKEALTQMDKIQKDKFLRLLKHQEEEQRKLKHAFEMQQKLLIEQLNKEMVATQIKTVDQTHVNATSTQRSGSLNLEFSEFSSDSTQNHQSMDEDYSIKHFPTMSNNSTLLFADNIPESPCDQSPLVPSLPISNLSSMDHSNANTSIDSSTITVSNQTSQRAHSLQGIQVTTPIENGHVGGGQYSSSSRRRLFSQEQMPPMSPSQTDVQPQQHMKVVLSPSPSPSPSSSNHRLSETHQHQQYQSYTSAKKSHVGLANNANNSRRDGGIDDHVATKAATTINAYVRGFLIRRLFQTEQIQRIVQTIHDTLIFVLNLHIETCENPSEGNSVANIKLKARLLQQLSSATRTLHLVFFQTSVRERMDIIARDRKLIRTKLLAVNRQRTPRITG